jgi:hypothetical protein
MRLTYHMLITHFIFHVPSRWNNCRSPSTFSKLYMSILTCRSYGIDWNQKFEEKSTVLQWFTSCFVIFVLSLTYLYGVLCTSRQQTFWEFLLTMFLPLVSYYSFVTPYNLKQSPPRLRSLILIETSFNVLVVGSKFVIEYWKYEEYMYLNQLFACFFVVQTYGFVENEYRYRKSFSMIRSLSLFAGILLQVTTNMQTRDLENNLIDGQGRFLVFGKNTPFNIMAHYGFWLLGVLYVDYEDSVPNSAIQSTHFASYVISCLSGEFWHARLLTASHLFNFMVPRWNNDIICSISLEAANCSVLLSQRICICQSHFAFWMYNLFTRFDIMRSQYDNV